MEKKMTIISKLAISLFGIFFLSGCGGVATVQIPESKILSDQSKGHIIIGRAPSIAGTLRDSNIYTFSKADLTAQHVAKITNGSKTIYSVDAGTHYLYSDELDNWSPRDIKVLNFNIIDIKNGEVKYFDSSLKEYEPNRENLTNELANSSCNQQTLDNFLLNEVQQDGKENSIGQVATKNKNVYKGENSLFEITCDKEKIAQVKDHYYRFNKIKFDDIETVKLPQHKFAKVDNSVSKIIKNYYSNWEAKYQDIPLIHRADTDHLLGSHPFIQIRSIPNKDYYKAFNSVIFYDISNDVPNKDMLSRFNKSINAAFSSNSSTNATNQLIVKYSVAKYEEGSQTGRYMSGFSDLNKNIGAIHIRVGFYNNQNILISSVELSEVLVGGVLGGFNTMESDSIRMLKEYINRNFIKNSI